MTNYIDPYIMKKTFIYLIQNYDSLNDSQIAEVTKLLQFYGIDTGFYDIYMLANFGELLIMESYAKEEYNQEDILGLPGGRAGICGYSSASVFYNALKLISNSSPHTFKVFNHQVRELGLKESHEFVVVKYRFSNNYIKNREFTILFDHSVHQFLKVHDNGRVITSCKDDTYPNIESSSTVFNLGEFIDSTRGHIMHLLTHGFMVINDSASNENYAVLNVLDAYCRMLGFNLLNKDLSDLYDKLLSPTIEPDFDFDEIYPSEKQVERMEKESFVPIIITPGTQKLELLSKSMDFQSLDRNLEIFAKYPVYKNIADNITPIKIDEINPKAALILSLENSEVEIQ